jgi:hypothetical protein
MGKKKRPGSVIAQCLTRGNCGGETDTGQAGQPEFLEGSRHGNGEEARPVHTALSALTSQWTRSDSLCPVTDNVANSLGTNDWRLAPLPLSRRNNGDREGARGNWRLEFPLEKIFPSSCLPGPAAFRFNAP